MRIDIVSKEFPPSIYGGAGVHVAELTRALGEAHLEARVWKKSAEGRLGPSRTSR